MDRLIDVGLVLGKLIDEKQFYQASLLATSVV